MHILKNLNTGAKDFASEAAQEDFRLADYPATLRTMETLQPLVVQASDPNADPAELAYMRENDAVTLVIIPMAVKGQAIGVIELEASDYELHFSPQELNLAMTLANQAAASLENARLFEVQQQTASSLAERVRELDCLNDIGRKIDETPPVPEFLSWVAKRIPPATRYPDLCAVAVEFDRHIYGTAEAIDLPCQMVQSLRVGDEVLGRIYLAYREQREFLDGDSALLGGIANRMSGYIENRRLFEQTQAALAEVEATHRSYLRGKWQDYLRQWETLRKSGVVYDQAEPDAVTPTKQEEPTDLAVPIVLRGQTIGVLGLEDPYGTRQWSEEDRTLVEAVSRQLALALENARLLEDTQRRAAHEQLIGDITTRMRETLDMETVLKTAIREIGDALGLAKVEVRMKDERAQPGNGRG
jgi:GAF domain-containing protein